MNVRKGVEYVGVIVGVNERVMVTVAVPRVGVIVRVGPPAVGEASGVPGVSEAAASPLEVGGGAAVGELSGVSTACTVNAAHVLGRAGRIGRIEPGYDADLVLLDASDWRHLAYHLGAEIVRTVIERGTVAFARPA